jgi:cytochrome c5
MGDRKAWLKWSEKGEDAMLANVIMGVRSMPPMGYCAACNENDFRALIRMIAGLPQTSLPKKPDKGVQ